MCSAAVFAQQQIANFNSGDARRPAVRVNIAGSIERNNQILVLDQVKSVNPGEVINWTIASKNEGNGAANNYSVIGQIPKGTVFIPGSTSADNSPTVTYSIDNNQKFSAQPMIEERQTDGSMRQIPAPISMYTQVRYEWSGALAGNSSLTASYRVRVK